MQGCVFFKLLKRKPFSKSNLFSWANELSVCHVKSLHHEKKTVAWKPLFINHLSLALLFWAAWDSRFILAGYKLDRESLILPVPQLSCSESLYLPEQLVIWIKEVSSNAKTLKQMWLKAGIFLIKDCGLTSQAWSRRHSKRDGHTKTTSSHLKS